jgi:soluble lytic murein transglycosylase-like protein
MAKEAAQAASISPELVCAVVEQESSWQPWAVRFEPGFFKTYITPMVVKGRLPNITEQYLRSFSWGLMQVMGEVAREAGLTDPIPSLCDPKVGLEWGCKVLARKLAKAGGDLRKTLLLWNGGANQSYPDEVMARMEKYK